jgi:hypothetical protein
MDIRHYCDICHLLCVPTSTHTSDGPAIHICDACLRMMGSWDDPVWDEIRCRLPDSCTVGDEEKNP